MQDNINYICTFVVSGFGFGLLLGFIAYYSSYALSQVIHLFKAISR